MKPSIQELKECFEKIYGEGGDIRVFFAPGRVNLIGEHTDYNGGHVFPCALSIGTYCVARKRQDRELNFHSLNFEEAGVVHSSLDDLTPSDGAGWTNYPKGVLWTFGEQGYPIPSGADFLVYGDIPAGSGLSSSASLEVVTALAARELFGFSKLPMVQLALIGQQAENQYIGMKCGIMDQFASAMGMADHAIFLDTNTLDYEYAPVPLDTQKIIITNSKVKHSLVDSAYNERRAQCEQALSDLRQVTSLRSAYYGPEALIPRPEDAKQLASSLRPLPLDSLCALTPEAFEKVKGAIKDPICLKRARHAVTENARTIQAVAALKAGDLATFGRLMNASHVSMRDDYEASCVETDCLAELAWAIPGVIGSRITGGGFGGCTVSIVEDGAVDDFVKKVGDGYQAATGHQAEFYIVEIGGGARVIDPLP